MVDRSVVADHKATIPDIRGTGGSLRTVDDNRGLFQEALRGASQSRRELSRERHIRRRFQGVFLACIHAPGRRMSPEGLGRVVKEILVDVDCSGFLPHVAVVILYRGVT